MNSDVKNMLKVFIDREDVKEAINKENWNKVIDLFSSTYNSLELLSHFVDLLIDSGIDICPKLVEVPPYMFWKSKVEKADLKEAKYLGSRCFRLSKIKTINLYKNKLENLSVGILSGVEHPVDIIWDGTYKEWSNLRRNSNCWYRFPSSVSIHCTDGIFVEDRTFD